MRAARPWQLLGVFLLLVVGPLALRPLWIPDESRYAEIGREMLQSRDWVVPRLLGLHYFEKPVAGYWFTALSQSLFGGNLFAARLPVALATALSALTVGMLAHRMWGDERKTWLAVFIYLSSGLVTGMSLYITLDPQLAFWLNLALLAFHVAVHASTAGRRLGAWALMGAACGMAFLTKGFIGWLLPLLVAGAYMAWQRRLRELFRWGPAGRSRRRWGCGALGPGRAPAGAGFLELLLLERTRAPLRRPECAARPSRCGSTSRCWRWAAFHGWASPCRRCGEHGRPGGIPMSGSC